ncbi:MAG: acyl-CoA dehydrogenase domain-containing protein [Halioglobus sp.]
MLSARLGDAHSELFIACSILKFHDVGDRSPEASAHAEYALRRSFGAAQQALSAFCSNFPVRWLGVVLRAACLPPGSVVAAPSDRDVRELGEQIMTPNPVRQALAEMVYVSLDPEEAVGRLESTYQLLLQVDEAWQAFCRARSRGEVDADGLEDALREAAVAGIIREEDVSPLAEYDARRYDCLLTDHFASLA